jgi:hypothetical protein
MEANAREGQEGQPPIIPVEELVAINEEIPHRDNLGAAPEGEIQPDLRQQERRRPTPLRLLDITTEARYPWEEIPEAERKYGTVSHVWGKAEATHLPELDWIVNIGAGGAYEKQGRLFELCSIHHIKYLWWDFHCIDQRVEDEMSQETQNSGSYYQNSAITFALLNDVGYEHLHLIEQNFPTVWGALIRAGRNGDATTLLGLLPGILDEKMQKCKLGVLSMPINISQELGTSEH